MKKLTIRNFGPLAEATLDLDRVNLIIGLQSSGKSCALKTACHCSWVEKRMELAQSADAFSKEGEFLDKLCDYHKMKDYICPDTFIEYESQCVKFAYDHAKRKFSFKWKRAHWDYKRPKYRMYHRRETCWPLFQCGASCRWKVTICWTS